MGAMAEKGGMVGTGALELTQHLSISGRALQATVKQGTVEKFK
jgi:hypothetical protein